jgi:lysophospholipase L1-like esterase
MNIRNFVTSRRFIPALLGLALGTVVWGQVASVRIVIIGDSTVCNYAASKYPWAGWGQEIGLYFKPGSVTILNNAVGGRSSRSFVTKGQWATTSATLKSGDYLFIQFGHNDRDFSDTSRYADTATYKQYLGMYITQARAKGVHPVLVTPMNMNTWTDTTKRIVREVFTEGANNYRAAMIHVGDSLHVPVLDLEKKSTLLMDTLGAGYMTKWHFMGLDTGEYPNYPTGNADGTHFQEMGSLENARMVTEEISRLASDTVLKPLAALVTRKQAVTVASNLANAGVLTRSRVFPYGAPVTLKVKPAKGKTFRFWANAKGDSLTGALRYTFTMDSLAHSYTAVFVGGTTGLTAKRPRDVQLLKVHGNRIQVINPTGRTLRSQTEEGSVSQAIR